jgi:polyisoprenyl-phosphate glycosyltransferase
MSQTKLHFVVVPAFGEAEGAEEFHDRQTATPSALPYYESVCVDDHGHDRTCGVVCSLAASDPLVRRFRASGRYGHPVSPTAGVDFATVDTVTDLGGDLQHLPDLVPQHGDNSRGEAHGVFAVKETSTVESRRKRNTVRTFHAGQRWRAALRTWSYAQGGCP